ncbi:IclR family transcriptional regulator [Bosea robiniae]|uniref:DNA-binding transcriptional regulator, IclR family n=1 Tax=Bosea robiniae TaxID=1036780 RepID=A0ABY0NX68_9HYPH|nr:IclR family transcriptional regulator [Bosea robiniae]SDG30276.1 DNA-binding transcriptional regulator, IclR family [Bosea robiniae]
MDCVEERLPPNSAPEAGLSGSQSVDRALGLLSLIGREPAEGLPLGEIVSGSGLNKPTTRRLLLALMRAGLVEQEPQTRRYCLGEEAFVLGVLAARRHSLLEIAMEGLRRLSAETQDTSFLTVRRENYAICLHREEGTYPVRTHALQAGDQHPLGVGAGSLAMLAALPDDDVDRVIAANEAVLLARYPGFAPEALRADVVGTRARGFSLNPGRLVASSWGIGRAFRYPDGRVAGALSIAAIDSRMVPARQAELSLLLAREAERLEALLKQMFVSKRAVRPIVAAAPRSIETGRAAR